MPVIFSQTYRAKMERIKKLPQYMAGAMKGVTKRDATGLIDAFKKGIQSGDLGLTPLKEATIKAKKRKGYLNAMTPLYGKGLADKRSYMNCLRIRELKNGWKIAPSNGKHHEAKVPLKTLFFIHEYGAIIKGKNALIKIPPRPALMKAYQRYIAQKHDRETGNEVDAAINRYINSASAAWFDQMSKQASRSGDNELD